MLTSLTAGRLPTVPVLVLLCWLGVLLSREPSEREGLPAFLSQSGRLIHVELTGAGLDEGVYQINDGSTFRDVINLTNWRGADQDLSCDLPIEDGDFFRIERKARQINVIETGRMSAGTRMALSIPLHPDRMSQTDWLALPGIGEKLAAEIERDRQKNGDYRSLPALLRVRGVGSKKLEAWKPFFVEP